MSCPQQGSAISCTVIGVLCMANGMPLLKHCDWRAMHTAWQLMHCAWRAMHEATAWHYSCTVTGMRCMRQRQRQLMHCDWRAMCGQRHDITHAL